MSTIKHVIDFVSKNILVWTLVVTLPDFFVSIMLIISQLKSELSSNAGQYLYIGGLSLLVIIKFFALKYVLRRIITDFKNKVVFKVKIPHINYGLIPAIIFYYGVLVSGHAVEINYYSYTVIITMSMLLLQMIIIIKLVSATTISMGKIVDVESAKKELNFKGFIEIIVDMEDLGALNYKMGEIEIIKDNFYYKDFVFDSKKMFSYLKQYDMNIQQMSDDELTVAKMYCI